MPKKRIPVWIPKGAFTSVDLAELNPHVSGFALQCRLKEWLENGDIQRIGKMKVERTVKAHYIYRRMNVAGGAARETAPTSHARS